MKGILVLEDGTVFQADAIGRPGTSFGELVFNTAMSGYQEVLTDPSYSGQIVVMTAAHVGNYGVRPEEAESDRVHVAGFIARDFPSRWSGTGGEQSLADYLASSGVTGLHGLDTRALVRRIRSQGAMRAGLSTEINDPAELHRAVREAELVLDVISRDERIATALEDGIAGSGVYRLLFRALISDPGEVRRFYEDTVEPLVRYDNQYRTDLLGTLEEYLALFAAARTDQRAQNHVATGAGKTVKV